MSILSDNDSANNLDIFSYQEDFTEDVQVWSREIPDWNVPTDGNMICDRRTVIRNMVCSFDIETSGLKNKAIDACIVAIQARLNGINYIWDIGEYDNLPEFWGLYEENEKKMLSNFIQWLESPDTNIYILTGHNIFHFDLPYIMTRCEYHGIHCGFKYRPGYRNKLTEVKNSSWHGRPMAFLNIVHCKFNIVDTMQLCGIADKMQAVLNSFGLKYVAGPEGYGLREDRQDIPGDQVFITYFKDRKKFYDYLNDDINDTELLVNYLLPSLYYLLKYIPNINLQDLIFSGNGQKWSKILEHHYGGKPETDYKITYPGGFTGIKSGFYTNVAKLDVASLYPSIMLSQRVHSKKDYDMYQLKVLSLLKRERLRLKELGKKGDKEAKFQEKSFKILINSGYGALGTIGIPYNDMDAAATVTAYGRAVIAYMIDFCHFKGAGIIQADTDGIVIQAPQGSSIRQLHSEMQQSVPKWVEIDLEAEYDYVWMYRKKNYITYKNGKASGVGLSRKRDKSKLYKRYLKYLPTLYHKHGMPGVDTFTDNIVRMIENREIGVSLLCKTEKVKEYKDKTTNNNLHNDTGVAPGDNVTYYICEKEIEYITAKKKIKKKKIVNVYKKIEDFDNDYSIKYYVNEIIKCKYSEKKQEYTQEGWYYMFYNSINSPINSTSSDKPL